MSLFVAVDIPEGIRRQVSAALRTVQGTAPHLRFTPAASWHVTLAFLGRVEPDARPALASALAGVCARQAPFDVALDGGAATFGKGVLWAAFAPCPPLASLAAELRSVTRQVIPDAGGGQGRQLRAEPSRDEAFTAHLTVARAPRRGPGVTPVAVDAYDGPQASWRVAALRLLSSAGRSAREGYAVEAEWPLTG